MAANIISAVFDSQSEAERAAADLRRAGVPESAFSVVARHGDNATTASGDGVVTDDSHTNLLRGILGGGALGTGLAIAALAIPGVGPLVAAGAIAAAAIPGAAAIGAVAGAAVGTLNETLKDHGVDDSDLDYYNGHIEKGGVFLSVDTSMGGVDGERIRDILHSNGGHNASRSRVAM